MKASARWRSEHADPLRTLLAQKSLRRGYGVYLGSEHLREGKIDVLPLMQFLERLESGKIIP